MNRNNEPAGYKRPTEGDRIGGTLAEGRSSQRSAPMEQARMAGRATPAPQSFRRDPTRRDPQSAGLDRAVQPEGVVKGLETLHLDHRVWLNSLRFYREELFIFQKHLGQYVRTSAVPETMPFVEQYQNRFIRQSEVIDELAHEIKGHDQALGAGMTNGSPSMVYRPFGVHNELRERMDMFERLYMELKNDFRRWLAFNR